MTSLFELALRQENSGNPTVLREQVERMLADSKVKTFYRKLCRPMARPPSNRLNHARCTDVSRSLTNFYKSPWCKRRKSFSTSCSNRDLSVLNFFVSSDFTMLNERAWRCITAFPASKGWIFAECSPCLRDSPTRRRFDARERAESDREWDNHIARRALGVWVLKKVIWGSRCLPPPRKRCQRSSRILRGAVTIRELLEKHSCRCKTCPPLCHGKNRPALGFALESFDVMGALSRDLSHSGCVRGYSYVKGGEGEVVGCLCGPPLSTRSRNLNRLLLLGQGGGFALA